MLAEVAATDIAQVKSPQGLHESAQVAKEGAKTAKAARDQLEKSTGKSAISRLNAGDLGQQASGQIRPPKLRGAKKK